MNPSETSGRSTLTNQLSDLRDMTMQIAQTFSDLNMMKRCFLIVDLETNKITKALELSDKHFSKAVGKKIVIVDLKSQQVFDYERADWQDITEEPKAPAARKAASGGIGKRSKKTTGKKRASSTNRKTRGSPSGKRTDADEA